MTILIETSTMHLLDPGIRHMLAENGCEYADEDILGKRYCKFEGWTLPIDADKILEFVREDRYSKIEIYLDEIATKIKEIANG